MHASERPLPACKIDITIRNDGTVEEFYGTLRQALGL